MSGVDDVEEFATVEHSKQSSLDCDDDIHAVYRVEEHDIVLDQAEKFYLQLVNIALVGPANAAENRIAGYIRIEKVR